MCDPELTPYILHLDQKYHVLFLNQKVCGKHRVVMSWKLPQGSTSIRDEEMQQSQSVNVDD